MRTLTTNRFLTKMLRTLCCVGALTACSAWATVVTWQLNPGGGSGALAATRDISQSGYASTARGFDNTGSVLSQSSTARPDEPLLFAASNTPARPATELDESMARTFDEEFVSVPTVQFGSTATGSQAISLASTASGPGPEPVPEMSALFPIVGLIAAVSCTQILRRRRAAQRSASRGVG